MRIVVDTGLDIVNANDGVTSLREAIALAEATAGADEIVFSESLLPPFGPAVIGIQTDPASPSLANSSQTNFTGFEVNSGDGLTINGDIDGDGIADVTIDGGFITNDDRYFITPHFKIGEDGDLRLESLNLVDGGMFFFEDAADASAATSSANKSPAGDDGKDAFGSILNEGTLVLDGVFIDQISAVAQNGGDGGQGLKGFDNKPLAISGRDGAFGVVATKGQDGLDGDDGARGGSGGDGGNAAAIINSGDLTVINSGFGSDLSAEAGNGGDGGKGGRGGDGRDGGQGGDGYSVIAWNTTAKEGGDGGDAGIPGQGGVGGDGGKAALAILNDGGNVDYETAVLVADFDTDALGGEAGSGGVRGDRGSAGSGGLGGSTIFGGRADSGSSGIALFGSPFVVDGYDGADGDFVGGTPATQADALVYVTAQDSDVLEGDDLVYNFARMADPAVGRITVTYEITFGPGGGSAKDLGLGQSLTGVIVLDSANPSASLNLTTLLDDLSEDPEGATLTITGASTTAPELLVAITTDDASITISDRGISAPGPGTAGDDMISGTDFAEQIFGNGGNDMLRGNDGDDLLAGGSGYDRLVGDGGADQFVFSDDAGFDIAYDFTDGEDQIALVDLDFADLTISDYRATDTLISYGDAYLVLRDVDYRDLDQSDFFTISEGDLA